MQKRIKWMLPLVMVGLAGCTGNVAEEGVSQDELLAPPPALCDMIGDGTLAAGDAFAGNVTINPGGFASGTWDHFTPERPDPDQTSCTTSCTRREERRYRIRTRIRGFLCRLHERGIGRGRLARFCEPIENPCECDPVMVRDQFQGVVFNGDCTRNGDDTTNFTGSGTWNGIANYSFAAFARDSNGSGADFYDITITAPDGSVQYQGSGDLASGSIDIP